MTLGFKMQIFQGVLEVGQPMLGWRHPNIPDLSVGYNPFTNHLLTSWDIQVVPPQWWTKNPALLPLIYTQAGLIC